MTPQIRLILNEDDIDRVVRSVFKNILVMPPDIIAVDPIRNVFDGGGIGGKNDNDTIMFFLSQRVEELHNCINPETGIILENYTF